MFIMTDDGRLVNLSCVKEVCLVHIADGTIAVMADDKQIGSVITAEQGRASLAAILAKQQEMAGLKQDKNFERRLQKEQATMIAHAANGAYDGIVRYFRWRDERVWYRQLWWWLTRPFYWSRKRMEPPRKIVRG